MRAMIFAAGLGTRLRPLTNDRPKALVEVNGMTLLEINIRRLIHFGVRDIVINTHHFGDKIADFIKEKRQFGINIQISHEAEQPLETGGGLKQAAWFFENTTEPFFICNADVLSDIDLYKLYQKHLDSDAFVTYAIQQRETSRYMLHDKEGLLCGWMNTKTRTVKMGRLATESQMFSFSSFHVVNPAIFKTAPAADFFTIIDWYLQICGTHRIMGYRHDDDIWCDVGKPETLLEAEEIVDKLLF